MVSTKTLSSAGLVINIIALFLFLALCPIFYTSQKQTRTVLQTGNATIAIGSQSQVVDSVSVSYQLYVSDPSLYVLELAIPDRELIVPSGTDLDDTDLIQITFQSFSPTIGFICAMKYMEFAFGFTATNLQAMHFSGPCLDGPSPSCYLSAVPYIQEGSQDAVTYDSNLGVCYVVFFLINPTSQNWTGYSLNVVDKLYIRFPAV